MTRFDFAFAPAYRPLARALLTPETAWVEVGEADFQARFGPGGYGRPLTNITDAEVTGPYAFWKTAGPARLAITDGSDVRCSTATAACSSCSRTPSVG